MIGVDIGIALVALATVLATVRIFRGPSDATRTIAADLLLFCVVALIALIGVRIGSTATFDVVLVATLVGFLAAISLARALTKGHR